LTTRPSKSLQRNAHADQHPDPARPPADRQGLASQGQAVGRTVPTNNATFSVFLLGVIAVVTALQYLPALALGPVAEQLLSARGAAF
jgi:Potassium-transporting ATPase A subunit